MWRTHTHRLTIYIYIHPPPVIEGALIPSLRRTDKLGERFNDEQIDAILDSVQNFLLGLNDGAGTGGGMGEDGMDEDEEEEEEGSAAGMTGGGAGGADAMEEDGAGYGEDDGEL